MKTATYKFLTSKSKKKLDGDVKKQQSGVNGNGIRYQVKDLN